MEIELTSVSFFYEMKKDASAKATIVPDNSDAATIADLSDIHLEIEAGEDEVHHYATGATGILPKVIVSWDPVDLSVNSDCGEF